MWTDCSEDYWFSGVYYVRWWLCPMSVRLCGREDVVLFWIRALCNDATCLMLYSQPMSTLWPPMCGLNICSCCCCCCYYWYLSPDWISVWDQLKPMFVHVLCSSFLFFNFILLLIFWMTAFLKWFMVLRRSCSSSSSSSAF